MRVASLNCIVSFINNARKDKNYRELIKLFKEQTEIGKLLNNKFLDFSG